MIEMNEQGNSGVSSVFSNQPIAIFASMKTTNNSYPEIALVCC